METPEKTKMISSLLQCKNMLKRLFTQGYFENDPETLEAVREVLSRCDNDQQILLNSIGI